MKTAAKINPRYDWIIRPNDLTPELFEEKLYNLAELYKEISNVISENISKVIKDEASSENFRKTVMNLIFRGKTNKWDIYNNVDNSFRKSFEEKTKIMLELVIDEDSLPKNFWVKTLMLGKSLNQLRIPSAFGEFDKNPEKLDEIYSSHFPYKAEHITQVEQGYNDVEKKLIPKIKEWRRLD